MGQENLYTITSKTNKNLKLYLMTQKLLFAGIFLMGLLFFNTANAQPTFIGGTPQAFTICENSGAYDFSSLLNISDPDVGMTLTWSLFTPPLNGAISGLPGTATSTGSIATIAGVTYTPNPGYSGTDGLRIEVNDGTNPPVYVIINITVNPPPPPSPITGLTTVCIGGDIILHDTASGTWSEINGNTSVSPSGDVSGLLAGYDTVLYTVTDACGSTNDSFTVLSSSTPYITPILASFTHGCSGSAEFLADSTGGGFWTASNTRVSVGIGSGLLVADSAGGRDTITYTVTLACGTVDTTFVFTDDSLPVLGPISGPLSVCVGATITLIDPTMGGYWNPIFGNTDALVSGSGGVTGLNAGVDTIVYAVYNACGPSNVIFPVTVNPLPLAGTISGLHDSVCQGSTLTLTEVGAAPAGTWSATNTNAAVTAGVVTGVSGGTDVISYTVTNVCGTVYATYPVTVNPLAIAGAIAGLPSVCVDASITLSNTTAIPAGTWTIDNAHASLTAGGVVTGVTAGLDTIKYTVSNICNTITLTHPITVNPLPFAGPISGPNHVCAGTADTITLTDTVATGVWFSPAATVWVNSTTGQVTGLSGGMALITYTYTNVCGSDTVTHLDTVRVLPDSGYITGPVTVCAGASITLADTTSGGVWGSTGSTASVATSGIVSGITAGIDTIKYTVYNECGSTTARYPVTVVTTTPSAGVISGDTAICPDLFVSLMESVSGGSWTVSVNDSVAFLDASGVIAGNHPGHVTVTYTVFNGCGTTSTTYGVTVLSQAVCDRTAVPQVNAAATEVTIFPNPATDELTIKTADGGYSICTITNEIGQVMLRQPLNTKETTVNVHGFAPGLYNITISGADGIVTKKLVKE